MFPLSYNSFPQSPEIHRAAEYDRWLRINEFQTTVSIVADEIPITGSVAARLRNTANRYGFGPEEFVDYIVGVLNGTEAIASKQKELLPITAKVEIARVVITSSLSNFRQPLVLWSGTKESTLVLYLVREISIELGRLIPNVLFIDHYMHFDETLSYTKRLAIDWNLDLTVLKNENFVDRKYGESIRASELPDDQKAELKKIGFMGETFPLSLENVAANYLLNLHVLNQFVKKGGFDSVFMSEDSLTTIRVVHSFLSKDEGLARIAPLLLLDEQEVWSYMRENNIPVHPLYVKGNEKIFNKYGTDKTHNFVESTEINEDEYSGVMENLKRLGYA